MSKSIEPVGGPFARRRAEIAATIERTGLPPRGEGIPIAWLRTISGGDLDVLLTNDDVLIGRAHGCDLVLRHDTVSRQHLRLQFRSGHWYAIRLPTAAPTRLNDRDIPEGRPVRLASGDVLTLGRDVALRLTTPSEAATALGMDTGGESVTGGRHSNEDSLLMLSDLVAVADGVGGRPGGAVASALAVDMLRHLPRLLTLQQFAPVIDAAVRSLAASDPAQRHMATTLDAAHLINEAGTWKVAGVHIGDGMAIVDDGVRLTVLTQPHNLGGQLAAEGNPAAGRHPERDRLVRAFGLPESQSDAWTHRAAAGNRYILTTDGIPTALGPDRFIRALGALRRRTPHDAARALIDVAGREAVIPPGDIDNLTVVIADVVQIEDAPGHVKGSGL
ncbi:hypothetical protein GCM10009557_12310 [Virgisporangium ochraceum]|uniref:Protein serine/threonine phosphatase n=1 Tax=Virgisporangium ochraceum TaxID=65505 RepID=A0A8J4A414_9ACTN|nr:FHA domain-containing protein [Virgisporangium ochraceum]GIJ75422.1 hypothetical protein Voc01_103390 [Virgisporangium ochraceum]